jgi:hypothetical protein
MKSFELKKLAGALAIMGLLATVSHNAFAAPTCPETLDPAADYNCFYMDTGTDFNSSGSSTTSSFYELGYTGTLATSIYSGLTPGDPIYDSNIEDIVTYYGVTNGSYVAQDGSTMQSFQTAPAFPGEQNIDALNGPTPKETNNFDPENTFDAGWGLTYDYYLTGSFTAAGPDYNGGYIDVVFQDWVNSTSEQLLRIDITGSTLSAANLDLFGNVTYDWMGGAADIYGLATPDGTNDCTTTLCQDFFNMETAANSFYSLVEGSGVMITMKLDTNVNPPVPTNDQLVAFTGTDGKTYYARQTTEDGSIRFATPEPASLVLMGMGLAGLGASLRRKA